jgi:hypothetical protein
LPFLVLATQNPIEMERIPAAEAPRRPVPAQAAGALPGDGGAHRKHFQFQQGPIFLLAHPVHSSCLNSIYPSPVTTQSTPSGNSNSSPNPAPLTRAKYSAGVDITRHRDRTTVPSILDFRTVSLGSCVRRARYGRREHRRGGQHHSLCGRAGRANMALLAGLSRRALTFSFHATHTRN